jgi:hypothetical protein
MPIDDEELLAHTEHNIRLGRQRIARQIERIERLQSREQDTRLAKEVLEILRVSQVAHLRHRDLLRRELKSSSLEAELLNRSRLAVAESKRLLSEARDRPRILGRF